MRKIVTNGSTKTVYDYHNGIEYKNGNLTAIYHAEGRATPVGADFQYEYTIKDHLGNGRVYFTDKATLNTINKQDILQESHYYAFGMEYDVYPWNNTNENKYQYNGKELNDDFGLNLNHQDWRWYDLAIGRWTTIDPKAEEEGQESWSPYHFSFDNPIRYNDPDGQCPTCPTAAAGFVVGGLIEIGSQMLSGKSFSQVDWADVGVEATKGAIAGSGAGLVAMAVAEYGGTVVKAGLDISKEKGIETVANGTKSWASAGYDVVADVAGGAVGKKIVSASNSAVKNTVKNFEKSSKNLTKTTNSYNKVTDGGKNLYGTKATAATKKLNDAKSNLSGAHAQKKVTSAVNKGVNSNAGKVTVNAANSNTSDNIKKKTGIE